MIRLLLIYILISTSSYAQLHVYDVSEIAELQMVEKRPMVVFLYTDWCRYCKAMEHTTLKNDEVTNKLNKEFYFIKFNGESKEAINLNGVSYNFLPTGNGTGIHQLAQALGTVDGQVNYPTLVLLNTDFEIVYQYAGYMKSTEFIKSLSLVID